MTWHLYCPRCGWEGGGEEYQPYCPRCGGPLELKGAIPRPPKPILGEGGTPLVKGLNGSLYKLEYMNPTGSFKDRGSSLSVWLASKLDYSCVVEDSSGNTGLSVAAYAGRLGIKARLHIPASSPPGKIRIARFMGAEVVVHRTREEATHGARRDSRKCFYVAHAYSPIFLEGVSSLADEINPQGRRIIVPVSSGTLLLGLYRGFLRRGIRVELVAVQSPYAASLAGKAKIVIRRGERGDLLDALVLRDPPRINEMSRIVRIVVVVGDEYAIKAWRVLARHGFIVEPSSATVYVADEALGWNSILILTGSGLKYHERMVDSVGEGD